MFKQETGLRSSSVSSFLRPVGVLGQCSGDSHRKEGPLTHRFSLVSSSRVFPLVMSSAGLFNPLGTEVILGPLRCFVMS